MDQLPTIQEQYPNKPVHQVAVLRLIRIHPGMQVRQGELLGNSNSLAVQRASYDSTAIDLLLTLLRHLVSLGYAIDTRYEVTNVHPLRELIVMPSTNFSALESSNCRL